MGGEAYRSIHNSSNDNSADNLICYRRANMSPVMGKFTEFLKQIGYTSITRRTKEAVFAFIRRGEWQTFAVIRIFDNGEAISIYNFVLDTEREMTYELLEREYERSINDPDPRSDEYEGYIAYNAR